MLELPHTLVGAAIGSRISNPLIAFPLAFFTHFLIDLIPHWNPSLYTETEKFGQPTSKSKKIIFFDTFISLILGLIIAFQKWPNKGHFFIIVFSCFFAVLPDLIESPYFFLKFRPSLLHRWIQFQRRHQGKTNKIPGLIIQVAIIIISILAIFI